MVTSRTVLALRVACCSAAPLTDAVEKNDEAVDAAPMRDGGTTRLSNDAGAGGARAGLLLGVRAMQLAAERSGGTAMAIRLRSQCRGSLWAEGWAAGQLAGRLAGSLHFVWFSSLELAMRRSHL